jgi:hypothetical protein
VTLAEVGPWTFGWEALVAIGTLVLAIGTLGLASATLWLASTTRTVARLTRSEIEGTIRPLLVDVPPHDTTESSVNLRPILDGEQDVFIGARTGMISEKREGANTAYVAVPIRNVGPGTAVLATPHPSVLPRGEGEAAYPAKVNALAIPPGDTAHVLFQSNTVGAGGGFDPTRGQYRVEVAYQDAAGGQFTRTHLFVDPHKRIVGVAIFHGHEPEPFLKFGDTWD